VTRRPPTALALVAVAVCVVVCLPLVYLVIRAGGGGSDAWSVLGRPNTIEVVLKTAALVTVVTAFAVAIGVPAAWLVTRSDLPGARVWTVLLALPLVIPSYVLALALLSATGPGGLLGVPAVSGFDGAVIALALATYPYVFLLCAAALRRSDRSLEEAAQSLGRGRRAVFLEVTLPALRPSVAAGALLAALYALSDFGVVSLMRFDAITRAIFIQYRALFEREPAAVLALLLVAMAALVLYLEARAAGPLPPWRGDEGRRQPAPVALGRWRGPALAFCGTVVGLGVAMPVAVLLWWTMRARSVSVALDDIAGAMVHSVTASGAAAVLAVLAAVPVGALALRYARPWTRALERVSYVSNALPGVVLALSLVFFATRVAHPLYGTLALLVIAYCVRFFPQALAGVRSALARSDPRLEEAARGLGRGPLDVFRSITVPLVTPGLLAGAALVFLSAMKELPATLLLRPIGFDTLATEVWTATSVSKYSAAAPPALALILFAAPAVWLLLRPRAGQALEPRED
jgi:iron(III) transport system permease protein